MKAQEPPGKVYTPLGAKEPRENQAPCDMGGMDKGMMLDNEKSTTF